MMPRTTTLLVQGILAGNYGSVNGVVADLAQYIYSASIITDEVVRCAARKGRTLGGLAGPASQLPLGSDTANTQLEMIERWLAAYFYCKNDPTFVSKSQGGASASFAGGGSTLDGEQDRYKRGAIEVDTSGCVNAILNRKVAQIGWGGKPKSQQLDYDERN